MTIEYWEAEYKKCKEDPHHFFTTYWLVNGKPATTHMSKNEFNEFFALKEWLQKPELERLKLNLESYKNLI